MIIVDMCMASGEGKGEFFFQKGLHLAVSGGLLVRSGDWEGLGVTFL
jgi:hypothetical protein